MEQTMVPEVSYPVQNPDAAAMALTGDTATDLANIAKELGVSVDANGTVIEAPAQPTPVAEAHVAPTAPQAAEQPNDAVEVPKKFQKPDGTVNEAALDKSTASLRERIEQFKAMEKEYQTRQNQVNNPPAQAPIVPTVAPVVASPQASPFEIEVANDLIAAAAEQGVNLDPKYALAQAKVQVKLFDAKHRAELSAVEGIRKDLDDAKATANLQALIDAHPEVVSEGMEKKLMEIRKSNPWMESSPNPYQTAFIYAKGSNLLGSQVQTPNPKGTTAKAPPTPVGPVARVVQSIDLNNKAALQDLSTEALEAEAKKLYPNLHFGRRY